MKMLRISTILALIIILSFGSSTVQAITRISIGTGGTGGVYYPIGGGVAEVFNKYLEGVSARAEVSGASIENCRLVGANEQQLALANADAVYFAYRGEREYKQPLNILSMFTMYPSNMQPVCLKSAPINSIKDLRGKRIAVGPPGGTTYVMAWNILQAYGIGEKDITPIYQTFVESVAGLKDGNIDAAFILAGYPNSSILDLATTRAIKLIPIEQNMIEKITDEFKFYSESAVPGGIYKGIDEPTPGIAVMNVWLVNKDLPEDLVYKMVKVIFEHKDFLVTVHQKAADMNLKDAIKVPAPMHPGAIRYFKEVGALK
jgi:TRAP transporter TAXI family solute receptor